MVEDNLVNQTVQIRTLQSLGYDCVVASNGKEGFDKFASDPSSFDIILMDFQMPIMDGFEATTQMRLFESQHSLPHFHIVGYTSGLFLLLFSLSFRSSLVFFSDLPLSSSQSIRSEGNSKAETLTFTPSSSLSFGIVFGCDRTECQSTNQQPRCRRRKRRARNRGCVM